MFEFHGQWKRIATLEHYTNQFALRELHVAKACIYNFSKAKIARQKRTIYKTNIGKFYPRKNAPFEYVV